MTATAKEAMKLNVTALSDRGLVRGNNEDSAFGGAYLLALADGMGGHAAGEVASQLMIEKLEPLNRDPEDNDLLALLGASARDGNAAIAKHVAEHPDTEGMGCTLSALLFNGTEFGMIHVGDSRGYRLRDGKLTQITKDDTFVQSLVDQGKLDPADVSSHPQKSLILKAYTGRDVEPTLSMLDAQVGDRLLLCSDGLSDPVTASTIESALGQGTLDDAASMLVELALRSGGPDNVTVVVAEVVADDGERAEQRVVGAVAGEVPEPTHPNSAASRAAKLNRTPQVIPPKVPSTVESSMGEQEDADPEEPASRKRRVGWITVSSILAVLVLVLAGGFGLKSYLSNHYYVAEAAAGDAGLTIQQGADFSLFGRQLGHTYQYACLNEKGELGLQTSGCEGKFSPFTLESLSPAERSVIANLDGGSYDEVQTQLTRLADKALPVCRTTSVSATPSASTPAPAPATTASQAPSTTPSATPAFRAEPGVNCREVA